jgi:tRNA-splicing ligase RtcB
MKIKKISKNIYEIPKAGEMNVAARFFTSEKLLKFIKKDDSLIQLQNIAKLPGILDYALAMPDIHVGYGFPIGGVAAFDIKKGVISPGGVGFDINCGVRLLITDIPTSDFLVNREKIISELQKEIPLGTRRSEENLTEKELNKILKKGASTIAKRFELKKIEEKGCLKNADPLDVSETAKKRGFSQAGTLGSGNHFLDILNVERVLDKKSASRLNVSGGKIAIMFHCGSRGLGHQVATDYIKLFQEEYGVPSFDSQLAYAPIKSPLGKKYLSAMNCAANFGFYNRQKIGDKIKKVFKKHFPHNNVELVYDVAHNIAKIEKHKGKKVCIHRKGATRAFKDEPLIIPGSMGTPSYLLIGGDRSEELSFSSTAHGAGRVLGRKKAVQKLKEKSIKSELGKKGILIRTGSKKGLLEEAPEVYKDIEEVIKISKELGLAKPVAKLTPLAVIMG